MFHSPSAPYARLEALESALGASFGTDSAAGDRVGALCACASTAFARRTSYRNCEPLKPPGFGTGSTHAFLHFTIITHRASEGKAAEVSPTGLSGPASAEWAGGMTQPAAGSIPPSPSRIAHDFELATRHPPVVLPSRSDYPGLSTDTTKSPSGRQSFALSIACFPYFLNSPTIRAGWGQTASRRFHSVSERHTGRVALPERRQERSFGRASLDGHFQSRAFNPSLMLRLMMGLTSPLSK